MDGDGRALRVTGRAGAGGALVFVRPEGEERGSTASAGGVFVYPGPLVSAWEYAVYDPETGEATAAGEVSPTSKAGGICAAGDRAWRGDRDTPRGAYRAGAGVPPRVCCGELAGWICLVGDRGGLGFRTAERAERTRS